MKQKLLEMVQVTVFFILMNLFLSGLSETETDAKTAPRVPKLGYFDRRVPKFSSRVTLATSGAGVACHILVPYISLINQYFDMFVNSPQI